MSQPISEDLELVDSFFASLPFSPDRFQRVISFGEENPVCQQSNEACWQKNRRARFVISGRS